LLAIELSGSQHLPGVVGQRVVVVVVVVVVLIVVVVDSVADVVSDVSVVDGEVEANKLLMSIF